MAEPFPRHTTEEAERRALADYQAVLGKVIKPDWILGYRGNDSVDIQTGGKIKVRVTSTEQSAICRWMDDDWLDPYWDVEIVEDPDGLVDGLRSLWTWGTSYRGGAGD